MRYSSFSIRFVVGAILVCATAPASAARPAQSLLPNTTKGFIATPNFEELRQQWEKTDLGQLSQDPLMKPFVEDLGRQFEERLAADGVSLGVTWQDLEGIAGGEAAHAVIQPNNDRTQHAQAVLVDVTGRVEKAQALLAKISRDLVRQGAKQELRTIAGVQVIVHKLPQRKADAPQAYSYHTIHQEILIACDHAETLAGILSRYEGEHKNTLATVPAFVKSMQVCRQDSAGAEPNIRWFIDPFGYSHVNRAASGGKKHRGVDLLEILENQGFAAVSGAGGYIFLKTKEHELLHRSFVCAPIGGFKLAARMLDFPTTPTVPTPSWAPEQTANSVTFNWPIAKAFEHSKTLVNDFAGDEVFEEVLQGWARDVNGPQVDVRKELLPYLGERVTMFTDYRLPITPQSERTLFAIQLKDAQAVAGTVNKAMERDPEVRKLMVAGQPVWEILSREIEQVSAPQVEVPQFGFGRDAGPPAEEQKEIKIPNSAVTVAFGHLIVASHVDFIREVIEKQAGQQSLQQMADYRAVQAALTKLGAGDNCSQWFSRSDESSRATYELLRQGKMPEAETMTGVILNRIFGSGEEDEVRSQKIDGSKLPSFEAVRRYLGPAGGHVQTHADGWYIEGCMLRKDM